MEGSMNLQSTSSVPGGEAVEPPSARRGVSLWVRRILLGLVVAAIALAGTGAVYQAIATARDRRNYPAPGRLVDVGGYRLHIYCTGAGARNSQILWIAGERMITRRPG
jgi:hypothetical protein